MRNLEFILFQVDEARRYIEDGRISQLRLALLLLDNAAEIQMELLIRGHLMHEEWRENLRSQIRQFPTKELSEDLKRIVEWQPLSGKEKRRVERSFDEKIKFLSERYKDLDVRLAGPLSHLHKYRNEAYHQVNVRRDTINTASKILLDINCEMLLSLSPGVTEYHSGENYSWLEQRFGVSAARIIDRTQCAKIAVEDIRSKIVLSDQTIASTLAENLESRIESVLNALDFVVENTRCANRESAIKDSHSFGEWRRKHTKSSQPAEDDTITRHSLSYLDQLRQKLPEIEKAKDRLEAFRLFSILEVEFEPVEENVHELSAEVDHMIQMESDIRRGK